MQKDGRTCFSHNVFNPSNAELNPICHLLALLGAHHILHISRIRVKLITIHTDGSTGMICLHLPPLIHLNCSQSILETPQRKTTNTPPSCFFCLSCTPTYTHIHTQNEYVCCSARLFLYSFSITLSPSHHSSDEHLTLPSIKKSRPSMDITFQCSSTTLI